MRSVSLFDSAGRRRSPATLASFHAGHPPRNKGLRYPPDPPTVEEIIAVMRAAGAGPDGLRLRGLIVVLWRAGLRISEAPALSRPISTRPRGDLVRRGKGGSAARSAWTAGLAQLDVACAPRDAAGRPAVLHSARTDTRATMRSRRDPFSATARRRQLACAVGSRRTNSGTCTLSRCPAKVPLLVIQRQPGHADLGITSATYAGSTTPRSSTPSTNGRPHDPSQQAARPRPLTPTTRPPVA